MLNFFPKRIVIFLIISLLTTSVIFTYTHLLHNFETPAVPTQESQEKELGAQTTITNIPTPELPDEPTPTPTKGIIANEKLDEEPQLEPTATPIQPTSTPTVTPQPLQLRIGTYKQYQIQIPKGYSSHETSDEQLVAIEQYLSAEDISTSYGFLLDVHDATILSAPNNIVLLTQMKRYYANQSFKQNFVQTTRCDNLNRQYFYTIYLGTLTKIDQATPKTSFADVGICTATHKRHTITQLQSLIIPDGTISYYYVYYPKYSAGFIVISEFKGNISYAKNKTMIINLLKSLKPTV